jgi:hypothetical protein
MVMKHTKRHNAGGHAEKEKKKEQGVDHQILLLFRAAGL